MTTFSLNNKPRVLFVLDPVLGHVTVHLRGLLFKEMFRQKGWDVDFVYLRTSGRKKLNSWSLARTEKRIARQARDYDVVYLLKVASLRFVLRLKEETTARVAFDLTDALWQDIHRQHGWTDLEEILKQSDAVTSENEFICEYGRRYNKTVLSIPVCTQIERFDALRAELSDHSDKPITLGWVGSPGTVAALESIREPLDRLFEKHQNLHLRIVGNGKSPLPEFRHVRYSTREKYDEEEMIREILGMDIGLFPPPSNIEDYRIRGALKGLLYMSGGAVPVCLNQGDSPNTIKDGESGLLINDPSEWFTKIDELVSNPTKLKAMGRCANEVVRESHGLEHVFQCMESTLNQIANQSRSADSDKLSAAVA